MMASKTVTATIDGQCWLKSIGDNYNNTPTYTTTGAFYVGKLASESGFDVSNAMVIKFTTPSTYAGLSTSIDIGLSVWQAGYQYQPKLSYAVCTSDKNWPHYYNGAGAGADSYCLASGSGDIKFPQPPMGAYTTQHWTLSVDGLESATSYYLFIYSSGSLNYGFVKVDAASKHSIAVTYNDAVVYIDTGSGFEAYTAYLDDGKKWVPCIPYRDNGSSWDMMG